MEDLNVVSLFVLFSCQTYEGSFSAVPGTEGHGGYAFCAFASLLLLKKQDLCDVDKLLVRVPFFTNNYFVCCSFTEVGVSQTDASRGRISGII